MELSINSGNQELDALIGCWMKWTKDGSKDQDAVRKLIEEEDYTKLGKMMRPRKKFGTAGIRGVMGPGFGHLNDLVLIQTSQGLAKYLLEQSDNPEQVKAAGVVFGFDARHNSERWAKLCAGVFLRQGFTVYLFSLITPTPWVGFAVKKKKAAAGVMVTASHNPKEDNGYKVFWHTGAQITSPHDVNIQKCILNNLDPIGGAEAFDESYLEQFKANGQISDPLSEMNKLYISTVENGLYDKKMNKDYDKPIVYTPMHGVGANYVDKVFSACGFKPVVHTPEQRKPDPEFPTVKFPNPEEGKAALNLAMKAAEEAGSIYIVANDPDADRMAIAQRLENGTWKVFSGNEIGALLGWWQLQVEMKKNKNAKKSNLYFIASTVSSKMLRSIANTEGMNFEETLTGFKWMAKSAIEIENNNATLSEDERKTVLLAYEESIGFMCGTEVLDKDGISACVRATELIAFLDLNNQTLNDKLRNLYETYGYHCGEQSYLFIEDPSGPPAIFHRLRNFDGQQETYPTELGGYKITSVRDVTREFDSSQPDQKCRLPNSDNSEMITFQLDNGTVLTLRTSGTEPKLKYYAEYCASPEQRDWVKIENELSAIVSVFIQEFIQPEKNGLKARN